MSSVTIIWAMIASACLTLAIVHLVIWCRQSDQRAHLLFSVTAISVAAIAACELLLMRAQSPEEFGRVVWWAHFPVFFLAVSIVGFVRLYFRAGRRWLGYAACGLRLLDLIINLFSVPNANYKEITGLRHLTFGGETISIAQGVENPWVRVSELSSLLVLVFVVDASITLWRRGDPSERRRALVVGGSMTFFILMAAGASALIEAGVIQSPYLISLAFLAIVAVMGYELGSDVVRAARLAKQLQASENALRESDQHMRLAASAAEMAMWMWDIPRDEIWTTNKGRTLHGLPHWEKIKFNRFLDTLHPEDRDAVADVMHGAREYEKQYRVVLPTGETRWIAARGQVDFDGTKPVRMRGVSLDITERKQEQDRFRLVVEASPNGIVLINAESRIVLVNAAAEKLFDYRREELIGLGIELLLPERFRGQYSAHRAAFHAAPVARALGAGLELFARRKDGGELPVEIGISPVQSPEGTLVLNVIVDVSARKQAESEARRHLEELTHFSRVAIMGEMAGSLAHELNQPLTGIANNASAGRRFIAKGRADLPKLDGLLEAIVADARRAGEIICGIRGMIRKSEEIRGPVSLNDIIASVLRFARSDALERHCVLVTESDPMLPLVEADRVQLQQVLLNLIVNACEAMRETPAVERRVIIRSQGIADSRVRVSVRDFGTGLPAKEPERIFEQFFSTKREGMGMGLAIARSIIASHGGELAAANAQGGGACVYFTLPAFAEGYKGLRKSRQSGEG